MSGNFNWRMIFIITKWNWVLKTKMVLTCFCLFSSINVDSTVQTLVKQFSSPPWMCKCIKWFLWLLYQFSFICQNFRIIYTISTSFYHGWRLLCYLCVKTFVQLERFDTTHSFISFLQEIEVGYSEDFGCCFLIWLSSWLPFCSILVFLSCMQPCPLLLDCMVFALLPVFLLLSVNIFRTYCFSCIRNLRYFAFWWLFTAFYILVLCIPARPVAFVFMHQHLAWNGYDCE